MGRRTQCLFGSGLVSRWPAKRPQNLKGCAPAPTNPRTARSTPHAACAAAKLRNSRVPSANSPPAADTATPTWAGVRSATVGAALCRDGPQSGPKISKAALLLQPIDEPLDQRSPPLARRQNCVIAAFRAQTPLQRPTQQPPHGPACAVPLWERPCVAMGRKAAPKSQRLRSCSNQSTNRSINAPRRLRGGKTT